jgi:nucleotide-binding universal stress UspA family protein
VAERWLDTLLRLKESSRGRVVGARLLRGKPSIETIRESVRRRSDVVLKSRDPESLAEDLRLLRKCPCAVWLVRAEGTHGRADSRIGRVLAAVDPQPADPRKTALARRVLELAALLADREGNGFHVLHAWRVFGENVLGLAEVREEMERAERDASERMDRLLEECELPVSPEAITFPRGSPESQIESFVVEADIDLVVMGTLGRTGVPGLLIGNTAEGVFQRVDCSILALKPDGFVSPVVVDGDGA